MPNQPNTPATVPQPLAGQVAIVTGASAGIGQAYAEKLAEQGADIASGDLDESQQTKALVEAQGRRFVYHHLDVSKPDSVTAFVAKVKDEYGRVDILVNNAGIYPYVTFADMTFEDWRHVMATNLDGSFLMCKAVVPVMREAKYGRIVNVCSAECWTPATRNLHYITSKMGVLGLTRALASEVGDDHIIVNCIAPGITDTKTVEENAPQYLTELPKTAAIKRPGQPIDMARIVAFLVSPDNTYMTGQVLVNDGGLVRI